MNTESDLRLEMVSSLCGSSSCPAVYRSDRGTVVVQGYTVSADATDIAVPEGEMLVEIPLEVLREAFRAMS